MRWITPSNSGPKGRHFAREAMLVYSLASLATSRQVNAGTVLRATHAGQLLSSAVPIGQSADARTLLGHTLGMTRIEFFTKFGDAERWPSGEEYPYLFSWFMSPDQLKEIIVYERWVPAPEGDSAIVRAGFLRDSLVLIMAGYRGAGRRNPQCRVCRGLVDKFGQPTMETDLKSAFLAIWAHESFRVYSFRDDANLNVCYVDSRYSAWLKK
jgi:hypothetical protein